MKIPSAFLNLIVIATISSGIATAGQLNWIAPLADCYDTGVSRNRAVIVIFYDSVTSRVDADKMSIRLGLSPKIQKLSDSTVWCMGDVSKDVVAKNMAKALGVKEYPTLSVLQPDPKMIEEKTRIGGFRGVFAEKAFEDAQDYIIRGIAKVHLKPPSPKR